jgi:hypothetical protein
MWCHKIWMNSRLSIEFGSIFLKDISLNKSSIGISAISLLASCRIKTHHHIG